MLADPKTQAHIQLMARMARTVGADLDRLSDSEWSDAWTAAAIAPIPAAARIGWTITQPVPTTRRAFAPIAR